MKPLIVLVVFNLFFTGCQSTGAKVKDTESAVSSQIDEDIGDLKINESILPYSEIFNISESNRFGNNFEGISLVRKIGKNQLLICGKKERAKVIMKVSVNQKFQIEKVHFEQELIYTNINDLDINSNDEIYIIGNEGFSGKSKITKLSKSGEIIWEKKYGGNRRFVAMGMDLLRDENILLAGREVDESTMTATILVYKINEEGSILNEIRLSNGMSDSGFGVESIGENIVVVGISEQEKGEHFVTLFKLDSELNKKETVNLVEATGDMPDCKTIPCSDGGFLIVSEKGLADRGLDILLTKVNDTGNIDWSQSFGSQEKDGSKLIKDEFRFVNETADGGFLIGGEAFSINRISQESIIFHVDSEGKLQWNASIGSPDFDTVGGGMDLDNKFYVVGSTLGIGENSKFDAVKFIIDNKGLVSKGAE